MSLRKHPAKASNNLFELFVFFELTKNKSFHTVAHKKCHISPEKNIINKFVHVIVIKMQIHVGWFCRDPFSQWH